MELPAAIDLLLRRVRRRWLVRRQIEPVLSPDPEQVKGLLVDLDDDSWAVRERASAQLSACGGVVAPALREALEGNPSAEVQWRIEALLSAWDQRLPAAPAARRLIHAIAVLDRIEAAQPGQGRPLIEQLARTPSWAQSAAVLTLGLSAQARRDAGDLVARLCCGEPGERLTVLLGLVVRESDGRAERTRLRHTWPALIMRPSSRALWRRLPPIPPIRRVGWRCWAFWRSSPASIG